MCSIRFQDLRYRQHHHPLDEPVSPAVMQRHANAHEVGGRGKFYKHPVGVLSIQQAGLMLGAVVPGCDVGIDSQRIEVLNLHCTLGVGIFKSASETFPAVSAAESRVNHLLERAAR
eukprot:scaffold227614_cov17-Prasinocladus_malaysianus.AAC.3